MVMQLAVVTDAQLLAAASHLQGDGWQPRARCLSLMTASDQLSWAVGKHHAHAHNPLPAQCKTCGNQPWALWQNADNKSPSRR